MKNETIVEFAKNKIFDFLKTRKRKRLVTYRGIELEITKKSTVFSIVKEYKEKDKTRNKELISLIEKQIKQLEKPLNFPL